MSSRFGIAVLAGALLAPAAALAAEPRVVYDDVQYPNASAKFATRSDRIDTGDVVYPSTALTITSTLRPGSGNAGANLDDITYPTADEPHRSEASPQRVARSPAQDPDTSLACHCAHT